MQTLMTVVYDLVVIKLKLIAVYVLVAMQIKMNVVYVLVTAHLVKMPVVFQMGMVQAV